jgi:hypothetical protein
MVHFVLIGALDNIRSCYGIHRLSNLVRAARAHQPSQEGKARLNVLSLVELLYHWFLDVGFSFMGMHNKNGKK